MRVCILCALLLVWLTGCGGGGQSSSTVNPPAPERSFLLLPMHYELLRGTGYLKDEAGGLTTADILQTHKNTFTVSSAAGFHNGQLVVVETESDEHVTGTVRSVLADKVAVDMMGKPVGKPVRLGNFYKDSIHPNVMGASAIAEFAVNRAGTAVVDHGTHVFIGDSWVAFEGIVERATELLPNATLINKGVAGNRINHVLDRFEKDVTTYNPDFVWVLVGTNDYRDRHTPEYYANSIQTIINRIKAIGAMPIIFDPSVGPPFSPGYSEYEMTSLSHEYASAVAALP